jgi:hypothetical protein
VAESHPANGNPRAQPGWWNKHWALRIDYIYGLGAWLLWDRLDAETRFEVARVLEYDADLYINEPAPAQLDDDTQAGTTRAADGGLSLKLLSHKLDLRRDGFGIMLELERCGGRLCFLMKFRFGE